MKTVRNHELPQHDLGCVIVVPEGIGEREPGTLGPLSPPEIDWQGKTPTPEEQAEAESRAARAHTALRGKLRHQTYEIWKGEFYAHSLARVAAGEATPKEMAAFTSSAEASAVFGSLRAGSFEVALSRIDDMADPLATQAFKDHWMGKISAFIAQEI